MNVGGIFRLKLEDDVVLHFTQSRGLFAVTKKIRGVAERKLAKALGQKYGPATHKNPNMEFLYKNVTGDLYIFLATHNEVHYVDRKEIDRLFAICAEWMDENEGGAQKTLEDTI